MKVLVECWSYNGPMGTRKLKTVGLGTGLGLGSSPGTGIGKEPTWLKLVSLSRQPASPSSRQYEPIPGTKGGGALVRTMRARAP